MVIPSRSPWPGSLSRSDPCAHAGGLRGRRLFPRPFGPFSGRMRSMAPPRHGDIRAGVSAFCLLPAGKAAAMVSAPCSREAPSMQPSIRAVHRLPRPLACWPAACWPPAARAAISCHDRCAVCASGARPHRQPPSRRSRFRSGGPLRPLHPGRAGAGTCKRDLLQQAVEVSDSAHARCQRGRCHAPCAPALRLPALRCGRGRHRSTRCRCLPHTCAWAR